MKFTDYMIDFADNIFCSTSVVSLNYSSLIKKLNYYDIIFIS